MTASWLESVLDLFFPPTCLLCRVRISPGAESFPFCSSCLPEVKFAGRYCLKCNSSGADGLPCRCRRDGLLPGRFFGLAWYEGAWRKLLLDLKYGGKSYLARSIGRLLGESLQGLGEWPAPELVTAIPLFPGKRRERGYNQAALLARRVGRELGVPYKPLLVRVRSTLPQSSLSRQERRENVRGAFSCIEGVRLRGERILLVDDIFTTGSTMGEASRVLKLAGAGEIVGAVAAIQRKTGW